VLLPGCDVEPVMNAGVHARQARFGDHRDAVVERGDARVQPSRACVRPAGKDQRDYRRQ